MTCQPAPLRCQGGWVPALQLGLPYLGEVLVLLSVRHRCYCNCGAFTYGFRGSRVGWVGSIRSVQSVLGICSSSYASASSAVWEALYLTEHHVGTASRDPLVPL